VSDESAALPVPADKRRVGSQWHRVDPGDLQIGHVTAVVVGDRALCITRTADGYGALDNRCPHQGGPLGEGHIEDGWVMCPWHGFEYDPLTGAPPADYGDWATTYPLEERSDGLYVELPTYEYTPTLMDQMVDVMTAWGVDTVFGMVGHSNLGLADALRRAEEAGRLRYFGIRHEGAGAFAASAYGKLTGRPAACFSIAGPGATNLLTGLWDAKVDRVPILALTGQVQSQVLGPGAFQEIPTAEAFSAVAEWSQTVVSSRNASELMALAVKHAVVKRDVAHIVFPDEVQERPGLESPSPRPREGRISTTSIAPDGADLDRAVDLLAVAQRPVIVVGNGARPHREQIVRFAERFDVPVITTFKAKGAISDDHPLGCGVLGRSGTPVGSSMMAKADCLLVLGASFSNHTGISQRKPTIQVDFDRMMLGKFHPVDVPIWGEIERTVALLGERLSSRGHPGIRDEIAGRKALWRAEKQRRASMCDRSGAMHPAYLFEALARLAPDDAVLPVDVGNNTYAFGHYFECKGNQDVLMSGYLGSIGFALPAALGAWAASGGSRKIISIGGDGGLGQYLADFTTAVKYEMPITHIVLNNDELAKISREQVTALRPVWQTSLVNPDFAEFARLCGGEGYRVEDPEDLQEALEAALAVEGKPALVEVRTSPRWV
jgi:thiamine pyrophosphate-dependent acetolactate synthase large subunit-like protein/nitrite reductase/ring-hydroxylating ferredoxin subunit